MTYNPWADACSRYPGWVIRCLPLQGVPEVLCLRRKVILIDAEQRRSSRRSALAHAIAHLDLEHVVVGDVPGAKQELAADKLAARRLIAVGQLADALAWCGEDWNSVSRELDVEEGLLRVRLVHLHPSERRLLRAVLCPETMAA